MARISCEHCGGTGKIGDPETDCPQCRGVGEYDTDWVGVLRQLEPKVEDLESKLDDIKTVVDAILVQVS